MWIELAEKLVDRCIQLFKERRADKKRLFEEYVKPIFNDFEEIHASYTDTFLRLRTAIREKAISIYELIEQIEAEYLFSEGQRDKLRRITTISHDSVDKKTTYEPELIASFLFAIHSYLTVPYSDGSERPQRWLGGYMAYIELLSFFHTARKEWEGSTSKKKDWKNLAMQWGEQKKVELESRLKGLSIINRNEREYRYDNRMMGRKAKKQLGMLPDLVFKYVQYINAGHQFSEDTIAIEYLDLCVEMMQKWYGRVGEIYWKLRCALN